MADMRPIPTPLAYRWRRFVQNVLPIVIFLVGILFMLWLWERQSQMGNAFGVVEAHIVDVPSAAAGILTPPDHDDRWREFQTVKRGELIGKVHLLQTDVYAAQIETIQKEKIKVLADMDAEREQFLLAIQQQYEGEWFDIARSYWRVQEIQLDIRDRETRIRTAVAQLQTENVELSYNEQAFERGGAIAEQRVENNRYRIKELERLIERESHARTLALEQLRFEQNRQKTIRARFKALGDRRSEEIKELVDTITKPFHKQLDVLDSRIQEVVVAANEIDIRAPVDGVVTEVFAVPGQSVQPGDPVIQIASDSADYIVSYIRHHHRVRPVANMMVKLRTRHTGSRPIESSVVEVGPVVEQVPLQHLNDPTVPEWGYPIKIFVPEDLRPIVKPGEQIDIIFPSRTKILDPPPPASSDDPELGV